MIKYQLLTLLFLILFNSCGIDTSKNIEFNGFKNINSTYKLYMVVNEGKGSKIIISDNTTLTFEIDMDVCIYDSVKCDATISRLRYEYSKNSLVKYIFDTDLDTVAIVSDYMELGFKDSEIKTVNEVLTTLRKIKGKSIRTTLGNDGIIKFEKNEISTKDYYLDNYYNPEELLNQIFKPSDVLTLFDFVFYPELGSYIKGKQYEVNNENDSLTFVYNDDITSNDVLYSEESFGTNEFRSVESRINVTTGNLLESKFIERIKMDRDIIGMYKIIEKEVVVQKIK